MTMLTDEALMDGVLLRAKDDPVLFLRHVLEHAYRSIYINAAAEVESQVNKNLADMGINARLKIEF